MATADVDVVIEADVTLADRVDPVSGTVGARAITYRSLSTGRRWQVIGNCDRRGDCLIGATVNGLTIETHDDLAKSDLAAIDAARTYDTPVTPEFEGCCPFAYVDLERSS